MQLRTGERRVFDYPESEAALSEWQDDILAKNPGALVVKLAFENLAFGDDNPVQHAAQEDDFVTAQKLFFEQEAGTNTFAPELRTHADAGHRFVRFHTVRYSDKGGPRSPSVYGGYWRRLALHFSYLNGPLGGETTYAIPQDIALEARMLSLQHEMHAIFDNRSNLVGAASVAYTSDRTSIANRVFYHPSQATAKEGEEVAQALLAQGQALERYRLPHVEPPQNVQQALNIAPLPAAVFAPAPQGFNDLLPAAFRW